MSSTSEVLRLPELRERSATEVRSPGSQATGVGGEGIEALLLTSMMVEANVVYCTRWNGDELLEREQSACCRDAYNERRGLGSPVATNWNSSGRLRRRVATRVCGKKSREVLLSSTASCSSPHESSCDSVALGD